MATTDPNTWLVWAASSKQALENAVGLSPDALHVHVGLAVFIWLALVTQRPVLALLAVTFVEVANEIIDLVAADFRRAAWAETFKDTISTLVWPVALLAISRTSLLRTALADRHLRRALEQEPRNSISASGTRHNDSGVAQTLP